MRVSTRLTLAACLLPAMAREARPGVMRLEYSGVVTEAGATSGAAVGERFSGTLAYTTGNKSLSSATYTQYSTSFDGTGPTRVESSVRIGEAMAQRDLGSLALTLVQGQLGPPGVTLPASQAVYNFLPNGGGIPLSLQFRNRDEPVLPVQSWGDSPSILAPSPSSLAAFPEATFRFGSISGGGAGDVPLDLSGADVMGVIDAFTLAELPSPLPDDPSSGADPGGETTGPPPIASGPSSNVPEPAAIATLGLGLAGLAMRTRRRG